MAADFISYWGIAAGTVAAFATGAVWYMSLAEPWQQGLERRIDPDDGPTARHMIISALTALFGITGVAILYELIGGRGFFDGLFTGFCAAGFFSIMPITNNYSWADRKFKLTLIDAGHYLASFAVGGAVYGLIA